MIAIKRAACPECLKDVSVEGTHYNKAEVVSQLWVMQREKCCYSECRLPNHGHGKNVEHFRPKDRFGWLKNDWENLLLVCPHCNGRQSNKFPTMVCGDEELQGVVVDISTPEEGEPVIIDPCAEDPEEYLTYELDDTEELYGQILPMGACAKGMETIRVTAVDDDVFWRARHERLIGVLEVRYRNMLGHKKGGKDDALAAECSSFQAFLDDDAVYAGLAREFARAKSLDSRFGLHIPGRHSG